MTKCNAEYVSGGHDPYGSTCDLPSDHSPRMHEGPDPWEPIGRIKWSGGQMIAGDRTPIRMMRSR